MNSRTFINNIFDDNMSKFLVVLFGILLVSSIPLASAGQFSIGGSTGSTSGLATINSAPYLDGKVLVSVGSNDAVLVNENNPANIMAHVGDEITVRLNVNDDGGPNNVDIVSIFTNFVNNPSGMNLFYANNFNSLGETSTSFYEWNKSADDLSIDHSGNVSFTEPAISIDNVLSVSFTMVWTDVMAQSEVTTKLSDEHNVYIKDTLPFTIEIVDSSVLIPGSEPTPEADVVPDPEPTPEADVVPDPEPTPEADVVPDPEPTPEADVQSDTETTLSSTMTLDDDNNTTVPYEISGGVVTNAAVNIDNNSIVINIVADDDGVLIVSPSESTQEGIFMVLVDGEEWDDVTINGNEVTVMFPAGAEEIEIIGTFVVPEFGTITAMILAISIISIIAISAKSRFNIVPRI
jgi:predicted secreted protein with PEFG-CTERM motif